MRPTRCESRSHDRLLRLLIASIWCSPIWIYLAYDTHLWRQGAELMPPVLHIPGMVISVLIEPTWHGIHSYSLIAQLIFNCLFYLVLAYTVLTIRAHLRAGKRKPADEEQGSAEQESQS